MKSAQTVKPLSLGYVKAFLIRGEKTVLVDTGVRQSGERLIGLIKKEGLTPDDISLIVITHAHTDHCGSLRLLRQFTGTPVAIHQSEADFLKRGVSAPVTVHGLMFRLVSKFFGTAKFNPVTPDILIKDEFDLAPYGVDGRIIHTPGHTEGSVSLLLGSGEAVVADLISGKPDGSRATFPPIYADLETLKKSIARVIAAQPEQIYTSHGGVYTAQTAAQLLGSNS